MREKAGFWTGGSSRHMAALGEAEARELAALEERLLYASSDERAAIEIEREEVRRRYQEERESSAESLYFGKLKHDEP